MISVYCIYYGDSLKHMNILIRKQCMIQLCACSFHKIFLYGFVMSEKWKLNHSYYQKTLRFGEEVSTVTRVSDSIWPCINKEIKQINMSHIFSLWPIVRNNVYEETLPKYCKMM